MTKIKIGLLFTFFLANLCIAHAQNIRILHPALTTNKIEELYHYGRYREVIQKVDEQALEKYEKEKASEDGSKTEEDADDYQDDDSTVHYTQPRVPLDKIDAVQLYYRGMSYYRISWFKEASGDLSNAQTRLLTLPEIKTPGIDAAAKSLLTKLLPSLRAKANAQQKNIKVELNVSKNTDLYKAILKDVMQQIGMLQEVDRTLLQIKRILPVLPKNQCFINIGNVRVFNVYYDEQNDYTRLVLNSAQSAVLANMQLMGYIVPDTPVFIMRDVNRANQVFMAIDGTAKAALHGGREISGAIYLYPQRVMTPMYIQSSLAHEYNHVIANSWIGNALLPTWFSEGLAQLAEEPIDTSMNDRNNIQLKYMLSRNLVFVPELIEKHFTDIDEAITMTSGNSLLRPSVYAQGLSMTDYLLQNVAPDQIEDLFNNACTFDDPYHYDIIEEMTGYTMDQFYDSWRQWAIKKYSTM